MTMPRGIVIVRPDIGRAEICRNLLRQLPEWFGRPDANEMYCRRADKLPMIAVIDDQESAPVGFLSLEVSGDASAEIIVMAVAPDHHRHGIGRALVTAAEADCAANGWSTLRVRTLGRTHPDPRYKITRLFYEALGFRDVSESEDFWGPGTPSLLMAKPIVRQIAASSWAR